ELRRLAAARMGLGEVAGRELPKVVLLAPPAHGGTLASRYFVPWRCHAAHALTGALCVAAACNIRGSVAALVGRIGDDHHITDIRIEHPSGFIDAQCELRPHGAD